MVFAAMAAELLHFQPLRGGLLVLRRRIVPVLALRALERDDIARHNLYSYASCSLPDGPGMPGST
jgi:hypothetical protein